MANVSAGHFHSLLLTDTGTVYFWGDIRNGDSITPPTMYERLPPIQSISAGENTSLFLDLEGNVWGEGASDHGQLCQNKHLFWGPKQLPLPKKIIAVEAGFCAHSFFIEEGGTLWSCGYNFNHCLGINTTTTSGHKYENLPKIKQVSTYYSHSLLLTEEGEVLSCGNGALGRHPTLEHPASSFNKIDFPVPIISISAGRNHSLFLDVNHRVWSCENKLPQQITTLPPIKIISAGNHSSTFLDVDGCVWMSGIIGNTPQDADLRQLEEPRDVVSISCRSHLLMLDRNGDLWVAGQNSNGQLGLNDLIARQFPVKNNNSGIQPFSGKFHKTKSAKIRS